MADASTVNELVLRWQELREQGRSASAEELCAGRPDLLDDLRRRLEALRSMEQFLGATGETPGPALGACPAHLPELASPLPTHPQTGPPPDARPDGAPFRPDDAEGFDLREYELLGPVGRGGMGEVFRGKDPALGRDLAVKVLRPRLRGDPGAEGLFQQEARVTGALQHPNIVPVHNLGRLPDGRLYYTMKLVRGRNLADMLEEGTGPDRLPVLLAVFEKVCQAVAFAHSRGVIHRDLKPLNIMLGAFGEVQVMDWGLAKALRRGDGPGPQHGQAAEEGHTVRRILLAGSTIDDQGTGVVGTPAYMAPEQARGAGDVVDERADVFGLGAILCAVLTGRPPYSGESVDETLRQAASGDTADALARLDGCGADGELVELCKACVAAEHTQRPRDGGAVAGRVSAYLAGVQERLRRAELERAVALARVAEERRRRRWQLILAASVVGTLLLAGAAVAWYARYRRDVETRATAAYAEALRLRSEARAAAEGEALVKWVGAGAACRRAAELLGTSDRGDLADRVRLLDEELRNEADAARQAAEVRQKNGRMRLALDRAAQPGIFGLMNAPNPDFAGGTASYADAFREYGLDLTDPSLSAAEAAAVIRAGELRRDLISGLDAWVLLLPSESPQAKIPDGPFAEANRRQQAETQQQVEFRRRLMAVITAADDLDTLTSQVRADFEKRDKQALRLLLRETNLSTLPTGSLQMLLAVLYQQDAPSELRQTLAQAVRRKPDDFWLNYSLALELTYHRPSRPAEAIGYFRSAVLLRPATALVRMHFVKALLDAGQVEEALVVGREAAQLARGMESPYPERAFLRACIANQKWDEAVALCWKLGGAGRRPPELRDAIRGSGRLDEAQRLLDEEPDHSENHRLCGQILEARGESEGAEAAYRKALELKPADWQSRKDLVSLCVAAGQFDKGFAVADAAPAVRPQQADLYTHLGHCFGGQRRFDQAAAAHRKAIQAQDGFAPAHAGLCCALLEMGLVDDAITVGSRAVALDPGDVNAQRNLGRALRKGGRLGEAVAAHRRAVQLAPGAGLAWLSLAYTLSVEGSLDECADACRKAAELLPNNPYPLIALGEARYSRRRYETAEIAFKDALTLAPDHPEALCRLGLTLREQGRFAEALDRLRRGHSLGVKETGWSLPSVVWLKETERQIALARPVVFTELRQLKGHTNGINAVAISPDGRLAVTADHDGRAILWQFPLGRKVQEFETPSKHIADVVFTPDGKAVFFGGLDKPQLWRLGAKVAERKFEGLAAATVVNTVAVTPDGRRCLAAGKESEDVIRCWDLATGQPSLSLKGHGKGWVGSICVSPDGAQALSAGGDATARLWDLTSGQELYRFELRRFGVTEGLGGATAFCQDGKGVLTPYEGRFVRLWDLETKEKVWDFEHQSEVRAIAVLADGNRFLSVSEDKTLRLWNLKTGQQLGQVLVQEPLTCVAVAPDGRHLLAGTLGRPTVRIWRIDSVTEAVAPKAK